MAPGVLERHEHLERLGHGGGPGAERDRQAGREARGAAGGGLESDTLKTDSPGAEEALHPGETSAAALGTEQAGWRVHAAPPATAPPAELLTTCAACPPTPAPKVFFLHNRAVQTEQLTHQTLPIHCRASLWGAAGWCWMCLTPRPIPTTVSRFQQNSQETAAAGGRASSSWLGCRACWVWMSKGFDSCGERQAMLAPVADNLPCPHPHEIQARVLGAGRLCGRRREPPSLWTRRLLRRGRSGRWAARRPISTALHDAVSAACPATYCAAAPAPACPRFQAAAAPCPSTATLACCCGVVHSCSKAV